MEKRTAVGLTIVLAVTGALLAQNPALKRTVVKTGDVSVPGREAVIANIEIAPGGSAGRHTRCSVGGSSGSA